MNLQCTDGSIGVQIWHQSPISNQVIDSAFADYLSRVDGGLLQAGVVIKVCMEDVDIGTVA